ncbi:MAG: lysophospholipid acyltransferase family protein [Candidatus Omnitrophica bacterium]|nr:lysophospholipid acyltransferase family protein [Candidatus Omnitrophota bacterium]
MGLLKKFRKSVSYLAGWLAIILCSLIVKITPRRWIYSAAKTMGALGYIFTVKQRKIALESLRIAFSRDKSDSEIKRIAKDCFIFMAKSGFEILWMMDNPELIKQRVTFEGKQYLDKALARGKGVILVSAHFGNFPLMLAKLSLEGYSTAGIMRQMKDARAEKFFLEKRKRVKIKTIYSQPRKTCIENSIRSLRANELLFILMDQNFGTSGVFVDFFGTKAATATGPIVLAQRTQAALLPCFIVRQKDDTNKIMFEPAMDMEKAGTDEETIIRNVQKLTDIIESYIRRYPAEWGWIHRRWKSQPKTENKSG